MDANRATLGMLVVGAGFLGRARAAASQVARGVDLVAVLDTGPDRAANAGRDFGVPAVTGLSEGLDHHGVDAVIVATPHADHDEAVRRSLEAGKHVLCEKPLGIDPDECRDLARLADDRGVRLATGFNHRFYPPVRDALALVSGWRIGRVESVRLTIGHRATLDFLSGWHADRSVSGGGTMMDNGVHACDLARKFLGEVVAAKGYTRDALGLPFGVESEAFALFRNHDRGVAEVRSSWTLESGYLTVEVRGSSGHLLVETAPWRLSGVLEDGTRLDRRYMRARVAEATHRRRFGCERSLVRELEAFASPSPSPAASGWDGVRATEMADAVYRAAASGSEVMITPPRARGSVRRYAPMEARTA